MLIINPNENRARELPSIMSFTRQIIVHQNLPISHADHSKHVQHVLNEYAFSQSAPLKTSNDVIPAIAGVIISDFDGLQRFLDASK